MKEIEVGEYVRTKTEGICRLIEIYDEDLWCGYVDKPFWLRKDNIIKHSFNIIDLIEIGDYVDGDVVLDIVEDIETGEIHLEMPVDYTNKELGDCTIYNKDIYEVLTHEQYKNNCYRLENKDEIN